METSNQKNLLTCIGAVSLLFPALYLILAHYNRPAADDYYFLHGVRTDGILATAQTAYQTWITRWTTLPFAGFVFQLCGEHFFWFHAITLFLLAFLMTRWIGKIFRSKVLVVGRSIPLLFGLVLTMSFFFLTIGIGESWFWVTSVCMYVWPLLAFFAGAWWLMRKNQAATVAALFCFLFIGGGSEVIALESLAVLCGAIFLQRFRFVNIPVSRKKLLAACLVLIISLGISWMGPGRAAREAALPDLGMLSKGWLGLQSAGYFLLVQLPLKIHWLFFLTLPWIVVRQNFQPETRTVRQVFAAVARMAAFFVILVVLHFLLVTGLLHSFPPARTSLSLSFCLTLLSAAIGWQLGALPWKLAGLRMITACFVIGAGVLLLTSIVSQHRVARNYAIAVDQRIEYLTERLESDSSVSVQPLPESGMLWSAEIDSDTGHFTNVQLRDYLGLRSTPRRGQ